MTPEEKRRRDAKASARAEKIKEDVMRAVAILLADAWSLDELREHVVRRLLALPKEERMRGSSGSCGPSIPTFAVDGRPRR
jgi:hypothetical protein